MQEDARQTEEHDVGHDGMAILEQGSCECWKQGKSQGQGRQ